MSRKSKRNYLLYLITNTVNGDQYVGLTTTSISSRWNQHKYDAKSGKRYKLYNAIRKYGLENFNIEHIASALSESDLLELEKILIQQFNTYGRHGRRGYNLTRGGEGAEGAGIKRVVKGMEFDSTTDASEYFGIDRSTVYNRMRVLGWSLEQALGVEPPSHKAPSQAVEYKLGNNTYESFWKACEEHDLNYETARHRLLRGWTKEQAFGLSAPPPIKATTGNQIEVDGIVFSSKAEAARHFNVSRFTVDSRLRSGWSVEQSFELEPPPPRRYRQGHKVLVSGMLFNSKAEAAKHFGIEEGTVATRLARSDKLSMEQVYGLEPFPKKVRKHETYYREGDRITVEGVEYKSNAAAARAYGLTPAKLHARINKLGWSLDQALGIETPPKNVHNVITKSAVTAEGKNYPNLASACRAYGIKYDRALQRIKKLGWSVEKSLEIEE